jgi:WD40-like Beta Propeller Repeat
MHFSCVRGSILALVALVSACDSNHTAGNGDDGGVTCKVGLVSIALSPAAPAVTLDGTAAAPITFTATGTFSDGHSEEIAGAQLDWSVTRTDDTPPGSIAAGVLQPNASTGGVVTVAATDGCISGTTTVTFTLNAVVGTPSNSGDWAGTPVTTGTLPLVVYPSDQTRFPRNIYRTLFQWKSQGYSEFRLTFAGTGSTVTVYTDGVDLQCAGANGAGCWEADETAWAFIAGSNAGGTVTWTIDALDRSTATPTIRRGAPITIGFSRRDIKGAVFYWSTTSAGVRRANVADAVPEDYVTGVPGTVYPNGDSVDCVACHVVSRDGKYLAAPTKASWDTSLTIYQVTADIPPPVLVKTVENTDGHGFATISPDDNYVVAAWAGVMWMVDRATGNFVSDIALAGLKGTHPDWSPDNTQLVFATGAGDAPGGASIATLPYLGGQAWGTPKKITTPGGQTDLFPMFSPDGSWIAFSRGKGGHGDNTAQLWLVRKDGSDPIELLAANRVVNNATTTGQHQNSQPTWAPPSDEDLEWVAFNSKRAYGVVLGAGTQQIWVAAVDKARLEAGEEPSYPAFRLQFQGLKENNHRAYWTLDVRDPDPNQPDAGPLPDAGMCIAAGSTCVPGQDVCCDSGYFCDTQDNGATYKCLMPIVP